MKYDTRYPSVADLKLRARKRIPNFAYDYVDGAIDEEIGKKRNRDAFHEIVMTPRYLIDVTSVSTESELFGRKYSLPIGVPPIGLGNMMWPGAEMALATAAQKSNIPYILSTFSTTLLEEIADTAKDVCWFQLYVPKKQSVMKEIIDRAKKSGFNALVVTLDIPVGAKRNRELKNGLKLPFSFTPNIIWQSMIHPRWAMGTLMHGAPDFVNVLPYKEGPNQGLAEFISDFAMAGVTLERLKEIRKLWDGPLILKGTQYEKNALDAINLGVDGFIVSNHGGRQLDAAPSSVQTLREMSEQVRKTATIMLDSGIRTGMDVVRAKALGADFSFSGRSFYYGMGAMGKEGANQVIEIFRDEITRTLQQVGCHAFEQMDSSWLS
ncbi:MAG: alpha-hydroxy-acid oxidizing protein [Gammaproteobacteria bacterium]|nr:alpha-hydroxy-acid oxidizing protein [Gammaproteobacteria bacterium]